ncbi:LuxR C-terminal-related transcriptional regulator [Citrobacter rodentium]|uniref:Quorum sensing transcriptional regulator CroR n=2 Tax=Citrobacter rodentium TaxID=67825 RepID=D2TJP9_CITRI|nr:LuxR C-terminal-related transcriptional regulator [Citrobacter rodentium]KIQ51163.1 transcriptional regulator [Citrobacter rodentium]QBY29397.1 LuxR family transcriptional regulator [Citrobacter rodentium]UHO33473.1 LuxR family transcriptional regulator [Citrobacter rodentium NBRC 105723 = DSM 16636]CBG89690.1 quorum sensing transcriptional regulator CroR [Citrobacter rodentium ICC168]HAT8015793.1 LuxR family transcriptional regulator [Citrobacter rodentium NBRC 105723 = DSM 16636]
MKDTYYNDKGINALIQNELNKVFEVYKDTTYAYAIVNKKDPSQMRIINNNPQWFDIYLERKYQFIDPVIIRALSSVEDFYWENKVLLSGGYNLTRIFNESSEHNIYQGHTFPLHDYLNNLVVLSIISHKDSGIDMTANRSYFMHFLVQLHQKTLNLYSKVHQKKNVFLSPRERQILKWVSAGKTYAEVSLILSITERTVKFHMSNAMKKLGVNNARHAVKLGMELRLLDN